MIILDNPERMKVFFWDIDINTLDIIKHKRFIIERLLTYGKAGEIQWLKSVYTPDDFIQVIKTSSRIDRKTAHYWMVHYGINKNEVKCLNRPLMDISFY